MMAFTAMLSELYGAFRRKVGADEPPTKAAAEAVVIEDTRFRSIDGRFDALSHTMDQRFDALSQRFDALNQPFDGLSRAMDKRFDALSQRFDVLNQPLDELSRAMDKRFDALNRAMDQRACCDADTPPPGTMSSIPRFMRRHPPPNGGELLLPAVGCRRGSVRECLPRVSRRSTAVHRPTVIPAFHALTVAVRSFQVLEAVAD